MTSINKFGTGLAVIRTLDVYWCPGAILKRKCCNNTINAALLSSSANLLLKISSLAFS